jgi:hypothetical protein
LTSEAPFRGELASTNAPARVSAFAATPTSPQTGVDAIVHSLVSYRPKEVKRNVIADLAVCYVADQDFLLCSLTSDRFDDSFLGRPRTFTCST